MKLTKKNPFYADKFLSLMKNIDYGDIQIITPRKDKFKFEGKFDGPSVEIEFLDWSMLARVAVGGDIAFGETYIENLWDSPNIPDLIEFFILNMRHLNNFAHGNFLKRLSWILYNKILRQNSIRGSAKNIKMHYDLGNKFYELWLDKSLTYSSALRERDAASLEEAQIAKYQRILNRLGKKNLNILEIGCGWGGFAMQAALDNHKVTGITISPEQFRFASNLLKDKADIKLLDYRKVEGKFDAIVSIEMFEALGEKYWPTYFQKIKTCLKTCGKAIIQLIVIKEEEFAAYRNRSDYIRHYIFPGGMLASQSKFLEEAEKAGLVCTDILSFGQDYAWTLSNWLSRFEAAENEIKKLGYTDAFIRKWKFYLYFCIAGFKSGHNNVIQVELVHA
jgi:cyclopropane-fatty-acyl-phospholipid synthase